MHPILLVVMLALMQTVPQVIVTTDRASYSPGDSVRITVTSAGLENDTLWLYVDKPDLHNLYFTELAAPGGVFVVVLPQDAPDGNYTVTVTWDHQVSETSFIVMTQTQTQTTTTTSSLTSQTESTTTESANEPPNPWPAFALIFTATVALVVFAILLAKWVSA